MGFARKQTTKRVYASPRPIDGSNDGSIGNPVPRNVPAPAPVHPHILAELAPAIKFLDDVKAAGPGDYMYRQMVLLLRDYRKQGLHPGLITRAEELFEGHPDLLVTFNTFLPEGCQCTVPE